MRYLPERRSFYGIGLAVFLCIFLLNWSHQAQAAINQQLSFYGTLQDSSDNNLTGTYDMVFRFYDAASGGTLLDTSTHTSANGNPVTVTNGEFSVQLGSGTGNTLNGIDFNTAAIYVGLSVEGDAEMTPRERLSAAAYAFNADTLDGYEASELVRGDAAGSVSASTAGTLFTITQSGGGDIFNVFDGGTEVFSIIDGGNIGIGTTSPSRALSVNGDAIFTGAFYDNNNNAGSNGMVLQSTGSGFLWVATSSLGITGGGGSSVNFGSNDQIPFMNAGGTDFEYNDNFMFDGNDIFINGTSSASALAVSGQDSLYIQESDIVFENFTASTGNDLTFLRARGSKESFATPQAGDVFMNIQSAGYAATYVTANQIQSVSTGNWTTGAARRADLVFNFYQGFGGSIEEMFRFNSFGALGLSDTSADFALEIATSTLMSGTLGYFGVSSDADSDGDLFVIDNLGNVGIGSSSPNANLVIRDTQPEIVLDGTGAFGRDLSIRNTSQNGVIMMGGSGLLYLGSNDESIVTLNPSSWNMASFDSYMAVGTTTISVSDSPARLSVQSRSTDDILNLFESSGTEVFTVLESGNVGIATSAPSSNLSVAGTLRATGAVRLDTYTNGALVADNLGNISAVATSTFSPWTQNGTDVYYNGGDVGVGTNDPDDRLHISGGNLLLENTQSIRWENNAATANTIMAYNSSNDLEIGSGIGRNLELYGDAILYFINGEEEMRLDGQGDLGFRDTTPDLTIEIATTSIDGYFGISATAAGDGDIFVVDGNGNVGINSATPDEKLHVISDATIALFEKSDGGNAEIRVINTQRAWVFGLNTQESFIIRDDTLGTNIFEIEDGAPSASFFIDELGNIGNGTSSPTAKLTVRATGTADILNLFETSGTEVFTVLENGNVGIGITNPTNEFHVAGTANTYAVVGTNGNTAGDEAGLMLISLNGHNNTLGNASTRGWEIFANSNANAETPNALHFTYWDGSGWNDHHIFDSAGNVGIGTTTITQKLTVAGNIRVGSSTGLGCVEDYDGSVLIGSCSSDIALKTNIMPLSDGAKETVLNRLVRLDPVTYNWNDFAAETMSKNPNVTNIGLVAQDVEAEFPELVSEYNGIKQVKFTALPFYIIEALKELWQMVTGNQERIEELEARIEALEAGEIAPRSSSNSESEEETDAEPEEESGSEDEQDDETASSTPEQEDESETVSSSSDSAEVEEATEDVVDDSESEESSEESDEVEESELDSEDEQTVNELEEEQEVTDTDDAVDEEV